MYIPNIYKAEDREQILQFMHKYPFAILVTANHENPVATHLPFTWTEHGDRLMLATHMSRANPQWKEIVNGRVLVIFHEPHAYISPSLYDHEVNVPTWNYLAVHAYGKARLLEEVEQELALMDRMIGNFEAAYKQQWTRLPDDYKLNMLKGIVAFEIEVDELQAKNKLSQNKTETEQKRIIESLDESGDQQAREIVSYMKNIVAVKTGRK